jgi:hypothetical protein
MSTNGATNGTDERGRPFQKGNPGRKKGSVNRATQVAAALLDGEEADLVRKAIEIAKGGDVQMLKFLLGRILPRERRLPVNLPVPAFRQAAVMGLRAIIEALGDGAVSPSEAAALAAVMDTYSRAVDADDVVRRMDELESRFRTVEPQREVRSKRAA